MLIIFNKNVYLLINEVKSMESNRGSILEKNYMKAFALGIIFLVVGVILMSTRTLYIRFADPDTPSEIEAYYDMMYILAALSSLFLQLGMVMFSLSAFWGGVVDRALSEEVRRGLVLAASLAIVSLALILSIQTLFSP
jgi:hypothetical protein